MPRCDAADSAAHKRRQNLIHVHIAGRFVTDFAVAFGCEAKAARIEAWQACYCGQMVAPAGGSARRPF